MTGSDASFVVDVKGTPPFGAQWYFNFTNRLDWGTGLTLTVTNVQATDSGRYQLVVANAYGSVTSQVATLSVVAVPVILSQPADQAVTPGSSVNFEVSAAGSGITYRWYYNTNTLMAGNAANLMLFNVQPPQAGTYHVVVANPYGSATSRYAQLTVLSAPTIITQPTNLTVVAGADASLGVVASGAAPLSYQWYRNATIPVPGGTNATMTISPVQWADAGSYNAVVTNSMGSVTSAVAVLRVLVTPAIRPDSLTVNGGTVSVLVDSLVGLNYRLEYKNALTDSTWTPLLPATTGTGGTIALTDSNAPAGSKRFYRVACY